MKTRTAIATLALVLAAGAAWAQQAPSQASNGAKPPAGITLPTGVELPADYVIGPEDVLAIVFWRDKDISGEVIVRPDGMITLPLINEIQAAGRTPEQLREDLAKAATKYVEVPEVTVVVKEMRSRKVFVTGNVAKQGTYALAGPTTVMQMIAAAGGLLEFAKEKDISVLRIENGKHVSYKFNYKDVSKGKNLQQNILLKPGDTIIVP